MDLVLIFKKLFCFLFPSSFSIFFLLRIYYNIFGYLSSIYVIFLNKRIVLLSKKWNWWSYSPTSPIKGACHERTCTLWNIETGRTTALPVFGECHKSDLILFTITISKLHCVIFRHCSFSTFPLECYYFIIFLCFCQHFLCKAQKIFL